MEASQTGEHRADALLMVKLIRHLYGVEERLRKQRASAKLRAVVRGAESRPVIERIGAILMDWKKSRRHLPKSQMGRAVDYALTLWPSLGVYVEDGRVEIDNNLVENAIRPTAVGKKNWLFVGDAGAGERGAILFTVIEACRRRGVDPFEYLRAVFERMPTLAAKDYASLHPEAWSRTRRPAQPASQAPQTTHASNTERRCA